MQEPLKGTVALSKNVKTQKSVESSVVHSTNQGSRIAYLCRTDNVRAHADMKIQTVSPYMQEHTIPKRVQRWFALNCTGMK